VSIPLCRRTASVHRSKAHDPQASASHRSRQESERFRPVVTTEDLYFASIQKGNRAQSNCVLARNACNAYNRCMQYTIRNVPSFLDAALRVSAQERGKSLNEVAIEALARGFGLSQAQVRQRDLSDIAGSWRKDPAFERALAAQDTVDEEMWR